MTSGGVEAGDVEAVAVARAGAVVGARSDGDVSSSPVPHAATATAMAIALNTGPRRDAMMLPLALDVPTSQAERCRRPRRRNPGAGGRPSLRTAPYRPLAAGLRGARRTRVGVGTCGTTAADAGTANCSGMYRKREPAVFQPPLGSWVTRGGCRGPPPSRRLAPCTGSNVTRDETRALRARGPVE